MTDELTRRRLIGGAAAGAAAAALGDSTAAQARSRRPPRRRTTRRAEVIVVGAGLAGLTAAREVAKAGRSVLVLEARSRVGGRTLNHPLGGGKVAEAGAAFIGPTQDRIAALARELGIGTFKTYDQGAYVFRHKGRQFRYAGNDPVAFALAEPVGGADVLQAVTRLDQMALEVPIQRPWEARRAAEWDGQTAETWKQANMLTDIGRSAFDAIVRGLVGANPRDVSLLFLLFYIRAAGNEQTPGTIERLVATTGGAQESRFVGGSQLVSLQMARELGGRVILKSPVRRIVQKRGRVLVEANPYCGPEARGPVDYFEMDWTAEAWTRGDPVGFMGPGVMLDYGRALREPVGLIHWAGTETSTFWNGYMDGAVRSGERAAREVLAQL